MWKKVDHKKWIEGLTEVEVREDVLARVVHWQLAKRRSGNHETKTEHFVRGSGKKIFRQKGTGNARQGSRRGPHFRGGAIAFGPHTRDHSHDLTKKFRKLGLKHAIASVLQNDKLRIYENLDAKSFKTKDMKENLKKDFGDSKVLFVDEGNDNLTLSVRNLIGMDVIPSCGLNVYDILQHNYLVLSKKAAELIKDRIA